MQKHIINTLAALALLATASLKADVKFSFSNDIDYAGSGNMFTHADGSPVTIGDNHIVGIWYEKKDSPGTWIFSGGMGFQVAPYDGLTEKGPYQWIGDWPSAGLYTAKDYIVGDTVNFMVRCWDYGADVPGLLESPGLSNDDILNSLANLIDGSYYSETVFSFSNFKTIGANNVGIVFPGAVLDQVVGGGQVPEPSTYAVLAGLAILAFVAD